MKATKEPVQQPPVEAKKVEEPIKEEAAAEEPVVAPKNIENVTVRTATKIVAPSNETINRIECFYCFFPVEEEISKATPENVSVVDDNAQPMVQASSAMTEKKQEYLK